MAKAKYKPKQWLALYEAVNDIKALKPWQYLKDTDSIYMQLDDSDEMILCSIMGHDGKCYGVNIYEGDEAIRSHYLLYYDENIYPLDSIMAEQDCFTVYWEDREDVPPFQKNIIKELGLKYRGRGNWPNFLEFRPGFLPFTRPNPTTIARATHVLKNLRHPLQAYINKKLSVDFPGGKCLYHGYDHEKKRWRDGTIDRPPPLDFPTLELKDELLLKRLKKTKRVAVALAIDIFYLNLPYDSGKDKPDPNLRVAMAVDLNECEVISAAPMDETCETNEAAINFLISFVITNGRPQSVHVRNPWILAALRKICYALKIRLEEESLPLVDEFMDDMMDHYFI